MYGADGKKIGSIERVMIGKRDGKVAYAVLSFGGFLGIGHDHYPVPWQILTYDTDLSGYKTNLTESQVKEAPKISSEWAWNEPQSRSVSDFYKQPFIEWY
jgi:hypothetical protein